MQDNQTDHTLPATLSVTRIAYLICSYLTRNLSQEEAKELHDWVAGSDDNQLLFAELILPYNIKSVLNSGSATRLQNNFNPAIQIML